MDSIHLLCLTIEACEWQGQVTVLQTETDEEGLGMVVHASDINTQDTEAGRSGVSVR